MTIARVTIASVAAASAPGSPDAHRIGSHTLASLTAPEGARNRVAPWD